MLVHLKTAENNSSCYLSKFLLSRERCTIVKCVQFVSYSENTMAFDWLIVIINGGQSLTSTVGRHFTVFIKLFKPILLNTMSQCVNFEKQLLLSNFLMVSFKLSHDQPSYSCLWQWKHLRSNKTEQIEQKKESGIF